MRLAVRGAAALVANTEEATGAGELSGVDTADCGGVLDAGGVPGDAVTLGVGCPLTSRGVGVVICWAMLAERDKGEGGERR